MTVCWSVTSLSNLLAVEHDMDYDRLGGFLAGLDRVLKKEADFVAICR